MMKGQLKRAIKLGLFGSGVLGSGYLLQKNDWEMSTVGVVRFGRAAIAVGIRKTNVSHDFLNDLSCMDKRIFDDN